MIKETLFIAALVASPFTAGVPLIVAAPTAVVMAQPVDAFLNTVTGGTPGKTISGDTARARTAGSKYAEFKCATYTLVAPYDYVYFTQEERAYMEAKGAKDHCARWEMHEAGELNGVKSTVPQDWQTLNK